MASEQGAFPQATLGIGTEDVARQTVTWAKSIIEPPQKRQDLREESSSQSAHHSEAISSQGTTGVSHPGQKRNEDDISVQIEHPIKFSQKNSKKQILSADPAQLRFWVRRLRAEVIREAAWNRHQSAQLLKMRQVISAQQRELVTARITIERLKGSLVRRSIEKRHRERIKIATQTEISKEHAKDLENSGEQHSTKLEADQSLITEIERLRKENDALRALLSSTTSNIGAS